MTLVEDLEFSLKRLFTDKPNAVAEVPCFNEKDYQAVKERFGKEYEIIKVDNDEFYTVHIRRK